jgi:Family of unknown function (DUF6191)
VSTFGGLDTLFNPAKRHLDEERLRLQSTREDIGDASGGKRIDLDSGRVKIARGQSAEDAEQALTGDDPADDPDAPTVATTTGTVRSDADADSDPAAPTSTEREQAAPASAKRSSANGNSAKRGSVKRSKTASGAAESGQAGDDENTPAGRARRRRAAKA